MTGAAVGPGGAPPRPLRLGVLASHEGTTLQAVLDACARGAIPAEVAVVVSNNQDARALERARAAGVPARHLSSQTHPDPAALDEAIASALAERGVDLVVLAGYMKKVGPRTLARFRGRIINTHPALLPRFGGEGMYGARVHRAVLAAGERTSGVTVHLVDAEYDTGPIVAQARVPVEPGDTEATLAARVQARERALLVDVLRAIAAEGLPVRAMERPILWRRLDVPGHEACRLTWDGERRRLSGSAVFLHEGDACRLDYEVTADLAWRTERAVVSGWIGRVPVRVDIAVDAEQRWRINGAEAPGVAGLVDVDLNLTPATNTLSIRRMNLPVGDSAVVSAAWLEFPTLELKPLAQAYRRTGPLAYRYELTDGSFTADLSVNDLGLVTRYGDLWVAESDEPGGDPQ